MPTSVFTYVFFSHFPFLFFYRFYSHKQLVYLTFPVLPFAIYFLLRFRDNKWAQQTAQKNCRTGGKNHHKHTHKKEQCVKKLTCLHCASILSVVYVHMKEWKINKNTGTNIQSSFFRHTEAADVWRLNILHYWYWRCWAKACSSLYLWYSSFISMPHTHIYTYRHWTATTEQKTDTQIYSVNIGNNKSSKKRSRCNKTENIYTK